jgi:hypothetical protein
LYLEKRICLGLYSQKYYFDGDDLWRATDMVKKNNKLANNLFTDELRD